MKKLFRITLLIVFVVSLFSCSEKESNLGDWEDNIKLSAKEFVFNASGDSVTVTTEGDWWWVSSIAVNNNYFYNFQGIDLTSDNYSIQQDCFFVERRDKHTLFIKLEANPLYVQRIVTVGLLAGDYGDRVTVTQKSK